MRQQALHSAQHAVDTYFRQPVKNVQPSQLLLPAILAPTITSTQTLLLVSFVKPLLTKQYARVQVVRPIMYTTLQPKLAQLAPMRQLMVVLYVLATSSPVLVHVLSAQKWTLRRIVLCA